MSTLEVNKITPVDGGTNVTLGDSGDTFTIPSGVTMTNNGSSSGFAPAGISSASTSGTALQITSGNIVGAGSDATNADLGVGIHIKTGDSSASVNSAADELVIEGTSTVGMSFLTNNDQDSNITFGDSDNNERGRIQYEHSNDALLFHSGGSQAMKIAADTAVLIGTNSEGTTHAYFKADSNSRRQLNLGCDTTAGRALVAFRNPNGLVGTIETSSSSTSYVTSSDYRLKENEVAISDGIERLKQLKPYKFNWKSDPDEIKVDGFFAHEVSSVVPEAISGEKDAVDSDNNPIHQGIDQSKLVPLLTSALQEAITKIETLEARVQALESA